MKDSFNINHTNYCKGIAIICMIVHHLFWNIPNIGLMIGDMALSQRIGIIGKVCVAIFLFLSGIGLYKTSSQKVEYRKFYKSKIRKLYLNYLFIVVFSVIFSLIFFLDEFLLLFGMGESIILKILLTATGLQYLIGYQGFNGAWWFMTVIIICYIMYPLLHRNIKKNTNVLLCLCFVFLFITLIPLGRIKIFEILFWSIPFILGLIMAHNCSLEKIKLFINKSSLRLFWYVCLVMMLISFLVIRQCVAMNSFIGLRLDIVNAFLIILNIYVFFEKIRITHKLVIFLGVHSMNIYYIHMFISNYYLSNYIYSLISPFLMILVVLILSLIGSYMINFTKKILFKW